jgi:hypothetical protein
MGVVSFMAGTVAGQLAGAWVYWRVRGNTPGPSTSEHDAAVANREFDAAWAAGFVTAVVATGVYTALGVHAWLLGSDASWGVSAFLGGCMGLCQGMLFRGRPLSPPPGRAA